MIHLIYGKNSLRSAREVFLLRQKYEKIVSPENIFLFSPDGFSPEDFETALRNTGLFDAKRLIVAHSLLTDKDASPLLKKLLPLVPEHISIILHEETLDVKTLASIKKYAKDIRNCSHFKEKELFSWIAEAAKEKGATLTPQEQTILAQSHPRNLWEIIQILERRALGEKGGMPISEEPNIFRLLNLVTAKRQKEAYAHYHTLLMQGVSQEEIFWRLYWQFNTLRIIAFLENASPAGLKKETGLHPFVIQNGLAALRRFSSQDIEETFEWLIDIWHASKLKTRDLAHELESFILTGRPQLFTPRLH
ncbi:MAG: hypothetical protein HY445_00475 [Candidatus Niyogibacteria bacterium]|nr:hypothetical protein [Candidatus Niyogibacteria bacterium]